jgi:hypothetical protein
MCNWLSNWYRPDGAMTAEEIADVLLDLMMNGLKKKPSAEKPVAGSKPDRRARAAKAAAAGKR